jgi:two-component system sensor histidine kinase BaeS
MQQRRRVSYDTPDEFGEMARAFNAMGDAVEEEDRLRRDFAAEVAHEVRTPLSIIRSQIEGIQGGGPIRAPGPNRTKGTKGVERVRAGGSSV